MIIYNVTKLVLKSLINTLYLWIYLWLGREGIEPSTALAIEFTAQPIIPTNGTFLYSNALLLYYNYNYNFYKHL